MEDGGSSSSSSSAAGTTPRQQEQQQQQHDDDGPQATTTTTPDSATMRSRPSDPSSKENNNDPDSATSSFKEFDSEIRRMSQDADKLLDSFRREAGVDERSNSRGGRNSSTRRDSYSSDNDDDEPVGPTSPHRFLSSRTRSMSTSDFGDDSMNDEWDRLEEATAAIRESLDQSDRLTESQIKSMLLRPDGDDNSAVLSTTPPYTPPSSLKSNSSSSKKNNNNPPSSGRSSSSRSKNKKKNKQAPSPPPSLFARICAQHDNNQPWMEHDFSESSTFSESSRSSIIMGNQEALMLAITVVWAAVVVALVQARYCLLDEDGFLFSSNNN